MFCAFEGPPRIMRLFGTGTVYEYGTKEYFALIPPGKRLPGSRAAIVIDVHKANTVRTFPSSCHSLLSCLLLTFRSILPCNLSLAGSQSRCTRSSRSEAPSSHLRTSRRSAIRTLQRALRPTQPKPLSSTTPVPPSFLQVSTNPGQSRHILPPLAMSWRRWKQDGF